MPRFHTPSPRLLARNALCVALASAQVLAYALPAQDPLLTAAEGPKPNLMLTLDNSGSMNWMFMAGKQFPNEAKLPNKDGTLVAVQARFHRGDNYMATLPSSPNSDGIVVGSKVGYNGKPNLWGVRMRSAFFNPAYYNPDTTYQPWPLSMRGELAKSGLIDGDGYVKDPAKTPQNPHVSNPATIDLVSSSTGNEFWCAQGVKTDNTGRCAPGGRDSNNNALGGALPNGVVYKPMLYFRLQSGKTGSNVADFDEIDINAITDPVARAAQRRNYTTWFTYYRNRNLMAKASTGLAFDAQKINRFRLGWGKLNDNGTASTKTVVSGVRMYDDTRKKDLATWLTNLDARGSTPLRQAVTNVGEYFVAANGTAAEDPYRTNPTVTAEKGLSCRRSYHILVTDGYWNDTPKSLPGNMDGNNGTKITSSDGKLNFTYIGQSPFKDSYSGTLADVAMNYWVRDIRSDLANNIPVTDEATQKPYDPTLNPAFWQHLVTFSVGLGVDGTLDSSVDPKTVVWPQPVADTNTTVDDLWHVAVNTRGKYLKATDPIAYSRELSKVLNTISTTGGTISAVAVSRTVLADNAMKFVPSFDPETWSGELMGYFLDGNGVVKATPAPWKATAALPSFANRNIFMGTAIGTAKALPFTVDNVKNGSAFTNLINPLGDVLIKQSNGSFAYGPAPVTPELINYLRGDQSLENNPWRPRKKVLGDLLNSQPIYVRGSDFDNRFLPDTVDGKPTGASSYSDFVAAKRARKAGVVVVGGNDGMLHGFRDSDGVEMFGFIPQTVLSGETHPYTVKADASKGIVGSLAGLARLADVNYEHQLYVDGQITEGDIYDCRGACKWKNIVVANTGGGAKSVFALDLSDDYTTDSATRPTKFDASDVLWQLSNQADLGYMTQPAEIGLMANGEWAAVFGNGYDSTTGKAVLYVVNAATGEIIRTLKVSDVTDNGLGGVTLVRNGDNVVVAAYAGDLKGNLWKFDLTEADEAKWKVDFGGLPLFTALKSGVPQPITAAPNFTQHPAGGLMLIVSTGKLYADADLGTGGQQTIYGLWDASKVGAPSLQANRITSSSQLVTQTIVNKAQADSLTEFLIEKQSDASGQSRGWQLDMLYPTEERGIFTPQFVQGFAYIETVKPGKTGAESCSLYEGSGVGYLINPFTGAVPNNNIMDFNGDGTLDRVGVFKRLTVASSAIQGGSPDGAIQGDCGKVQCDGTKGLSKTFGTTLPPMRTWRQLFWIPQ